MPDLDIIGARPQAEIATAPFFISTMPDGSVWTEFHRRQDGILLRFPGFADFDVAPEGGRVACAPAPDVQASTVEHLYLNQVLPLVLNKLGKLVFHASAVAVDGGAIAFLAESGRGKSTLAATFALGGHGFLTDDGLVVEPEGRHYLVQPSHPSIRLWADMHSQLFAPDAEKAPALDYTSKSRFLAGSALNHCETALPLRAAYFLGDGGAGEIAFSRLSPAEGFVEWLKHSFLFDIEDRALIRSHFDRATQLADRIASFRLDYPRRGEDLSRLMAAIIDHASRETSSA